MTQTGRSYLRWDLLVTRMGFFPYAMALRHPCMTYIILFAYGCMLMVKVAVCCRVPLVPVTFTA